MENWHRRLLLTPTLVLASMVATPLSAQTAPQDPVPVPADVDRRDVVDDLLDSENFEFGLQGGIISVEDFESNPWFSAHLGYHLSEYFYVKARYALADAGETSFEKLSNTAPLLTDAERELRYYGLNIGYNLFPGEIFVSPDWGFNSVFSIELGGGSTEFAGDEQFTVDLTTNFRVFLTDWIAWDISMSDYVFNTEVTGASKTTHNLTFATGVAVYF
ncbi:outer membrane beta-barrel domain-containing protein [uncultured Ferrimonas sp.]|uniref:outer membrane beta-barrel domain-containing protein n=1 Tax=uncultured Ferrimonas sp. TaxID=432640 RepID=UPI002613B93A|nr:outer membrane beta-barrel domain-containing protein [uncultured Ferrimonas sp.]